MEKDESFRPIHRLRRKRDIEAVFSQGKRFDGHWFRFHLLEKEDPIPRILIVVGRRVGKAVVRNKVKRAVREAFRRNKELFAYLDLAVIAREGIGRFPSREIQRTFLEEFKEARYAGEKGDTAHEGRIRAQEKAA
ncbi:ribonuclease P protein component [Candidatus Bipolaricaulota bacterium]|nr:ribonuclease P protein component [Candidatus Bipolaricaulota bacterium]